MFTRTRVSSRALGAASVETVLHNQSDIDSFCTLQKPPAWRVKSVEAQLRRFMGNAGRRKIRYAWLLVDALELDHIPHPLEGVLAHSQ
ncbi:MAG: hypothetical protein NVSMB52_14510 [Chloroflexota bacterium]